MSKFAKMFNATLNAETTIRFLPTTDYLQYYENAARQIVISIQLEDVDGEKLYIANSTILRYPEEFSSLYKILEWLDHVRENQYCDYDIYIMYIVPDGENAYSLAETLKERTQLIWQVTDDEDCLTIVRSGSRPLTKNSFTNEQLSNFT